MRRSYYCTNGRRIKCPQGSYCPGGADNHIVADAGTYTNAKRSSAFACEPGHYCKNGEKLKCREHTFGASYNLTSEICDGECSFMESPSEDRTRCKISIIRLLSLILLIALSIGGVAYVIRKRFKSVKARVSSLQYRVSVVGKELKKEQSRLKKELRKVQELTKLHKPSQDQEAMFAKYRDILRGRDPQQMPFKIQMYSMGNIELESSLGKGAYGEVYKGKVSGNHFGETIDKQVAVKQLHIKREAGTKTTLDNFVIEVRNLAAVGSHPNIVPFYGVAWDDGNFPSIILEFVPGGDLDSYLNEYVYDPGEGKGLGSSSLRSIALGLVKGVHHIHSKGMIHRDLKPQNVLLDLAKPPVPKIADFGMSREEKKNLTMTSVGTPYYVAPEIIRGERYSATADVFSLGIVLNQIDTLQDPSTGVNWGYQNAKILAAFVPSSEKMRRIVYWQYSRHVCCTIMDPLMVQKGI